MILKVIQVSENISSSWKLNTPMVSLVSGGSLGVHHNLSHHLTADRDTLTVDTAAHLQVFSTNTT